MMPTWSELEHMPDEELQRRFDAAAESTVVGTGFWGEILLYRGNLRAAQAQWELGEDTKALNSEVVKLTAELNSMTRKLVNVAIATFGVGLIAAGAAIVAAIRA